MLLPYRAKNPPEQFPCVTVGLIVINVLVYVFTSDSLLHVTREAVNNYALSHDTMSPFRLLSAMFLHADLFHLVGNMLFLWLFGAFVEGRLRPAKYLLVYFMAGLVGHVAHDLFFGIANPTGFSLGASGAIMGLAGAYLYLFPYSTICIFWLFYFRGGVMEWQARWVVLYYIGFDIFYAIAFPAMGGVAHMAHIGGFAGGLGMVMLLRAHRDSEEISMVQATHADTKDYSLLSLSELETLLQRPTEDMNLVLTYCEKAAQSTNEARAQSCLSMLNHYARPLLEKANPQRLAYIFLSLPLAVGGLPPLMYLRLASTLERLVSNDLAAQLYRRVYDLYPTAPETEKALFRLGHLLQNVFNNPTHAQAVYQEMLRLFPHGGMSRFARQSLQQL